MVEGLVERPGVRSGSSNVEQDRLTAILDEQPVTIQGGKGYIFDMRGFWKLTLLAGTGATVTAFRVDDLETWAAPSETERAYSGMPAAEAAASIEVDWPYVLVRTTGGSVVCAKV